MLLWVILGFMLQRKELRQNTTALEIQANELDNLVKQNTALVKTTEEQFLLNQKVFSHQMTQPTVTPDIQFLKCEKLESVEGVEFYRFYFSNKGNFAYKFEIRFHPKITEDETVELKGVFSSGINFSFDWNTMCVGTPPPQELVATLHYFDHSRTEYTKVINMRYKNSIYVESR